MIFTFYSYKGGVGRTMALANIAELWYSRGGNVLMVDWDLESPGLESFFPQIAQTSRENPGLIDLILNYKEIVENELPPEDNISPFGDISDYLIDVYPYMENGKTGRLRLLSAGKRNESFFYEYATIIKEFDWGDFYNHWVGERFIEWLRRELERQASIILIDSRSGVSELSGVCTYQMADVVIAFLSSNIQAFRGTTEVIERLNQEDLQKVRKDGNRSYLDTLVIPSRIEMTELVKRNEFEKKFKEKFDHLIPKTWRSETKSFWNLCIPYVPLYSFEERVAIKEKRLGGINISSELVNAYTNLWDAMVDSVSPVGDEPWRWRDSKSKILIIESNKGWKKMLAEVVSTQLGQEYTIVSSREEALKSLEENNYLAIILNLNISSSGIDTTSSPDIYGLQNYNGVDVLKSLKVNGRQEPVLVLTDEPVSTRGIYARYPNVVEIISRIQGKEFIGNLKNGLKVILKKEFII